MDARFSVDELLIHADWLGRLARELVRGADGADDVVQDTWLAALRAPPRRGGPAEPWLKEVMRNLVRRSRRDRLSRVAREEQSEPPDAVPTPERLLERAEAQRLLVTDVLALPEPLRSTVLLRHFEGLSAAEIARAQNVPAGTVRWRLKEGLDRLRAALDRRHDGDRRAWMILLAPRRASTGWKGGLLMAAQKKVIAIGIALLALLAGVGLWRVRRPPVVSRAPSVAGPVARRVPVFTSSPLLAPTAAISRAPGVRGEVEGEVVSAADGRPIAGAELSFSFQDSSLPATTDAQGRFHFAPPDPGAYLLARVSAEGYLEFSPEWGDSPIAFALRTGERIRGVRLSLRPHQICHGLVVDEGGRPVSGAQLTAWTPTPTPTSPLARATTDEVGAFDFTPTAGLEIEAHAGDRSARDQVGFSTFRQCALRLRLGAPDGTAPVTITGRVEAPDGRPLPGVVVDAWANPIGAAGVRHGFGRVQTDADGHFVIAPLDAAAYLVTARIGGRAVATVQDVSGGTRDLVLHVPASGRLRGRVGDADGAPVVSFAVVVTRPRAQGGGVWGLFARYDAQGAFAIDDVPAGTYEIRVAAGAHAPSARQTIDVAPAPAISELAFALGGGHRLAGQVVDRDSAAPVAGAHVALEGEAGVLDGMPLAAHTTSDAEGRFELAGVPDGRLSMLVSADGYNGRILDTAASGDVVGHLRVDLAPTKPGQPPRIELVGIGASVAPNVKEHVIVLGAIIPGGPASKAGLQRGDLILAIDGQPVADEPFGDAIQRIRGAEGSVVVLRLQRGDAPASDVLVTRALVRGP